MNVRHDDDFKISVNFVGEDGTPLNNSEVKFNFVYQDCEGNKNVGSRVITSAMVSPAVSPATTSTIGGVKMATSIADLVIESANAEIIAGKVNDLLNSLRAAGIIES